MGPNEEGERLVMVEATVQFYLHVHGTSDGAILERVKSMSQRELKYHIVSVGNMEEIDPHSCEVVGHYTGNGNYSDAKTNETK